MEARGFWFGWGSELELESADVYGAGVTAVASGEGGGREEGLAGRVGGVEAAEEDMSLAGERNGSVVSFRRRFARREVKNAGEVGGLAGRCKL